MSEAMAPPRYVRAEFPAPAPAGGGATRAESVEHVALVTLDRPDVLNALDFELLRQLVDALETLDRDPACRCIVLTGSGRRAFAAGGRSFRVALACLSTIVGIPGRFLRRRGRADLGPLAVVALI